MQLCTDTHILDAQRKPQTLSTQIYANIPRQMNRRDRPKASIQDKPSNGSVGVAQAYSVVRQSSAQTVHATSSHHSSPDTQHPLSSGTDTHVGPRFQSRHPAPRPRPTSSLLPAAHSDLFFLKDNFVARIELYPVLWSHHRGASGRRIGFLHP